MSNYNIGFGSYGEPNITSFVSKPICCANRNLSNYSRLNEFGQMEPFVIGIIVLAAIIIIWGIYASMQASKEESRMLAQLSPSERASYLKDKRKAQLQSQLIFGLSTILD
jgi:hypothetical protein